MMRVSNLAFMFCHSSNADRIREFIRNVYVNKKYAGGRTSDKLSSNTEVMFLIEPVLQA